MKDIIQYDDFAKLDIALGTVVAVELIEGADKLLKLSVEVGEETPRQILSGIREFLEDPQSLVGRQFPFVVNLAPRTIRGLESQGMILAALHDGVFAFLEPSTKLTPGARVN
jgi:methionine--tRNA ligase beta chain